MPLYIGVNETDITPPPGIGLCGYAFRPQGATAVHDPLFAQAVVSDNGKTRTALLGMDLIALDLDIVLRVRSEIAAALNTPPSHVLLNATHNHAGPVTRTYRAMPARDPVYIDALIRKLVGCAVQAANQMQPALLQFGTASVQLGINRRERRNGQTILGCNLSGPVDSTVRVLVVNSSRHEPLAVLYSHACHPVTMEGDNLQISAEFPGTARMSLQHRLPSGVVIAFLQGCCGNINPWRRGTFAAVTSNGDILADAVLEAISTSSLLADQAMIEANEETISLPTIPPPSPQKCQALLDQANSDFEQARRSNSDAGHLLFMEGMRDFAQFLLETSLHSPSNPSASFSIQRFRLGGLQIIGMPAEIFVQYGLDFERQVKAPVLALGYTNGCHNYLPATADYPLGGYEVEDAYKYYGELMYAPTAETALRAAAYKLLGVDDPDYTPYAI